MSGGDRVRFCSQCRLHVYNLSALTRESAEAFLRNAEGSVCVRLYRRPDGTVLTRDCRDMLGAIRRQAALWLGLVAMLLLALLGWAGLSAASRGRANGLREVEPIRTILSWISPAGSSSQGAILMGKRCPPQGQAGNGGNAPNVPAADE
jgi:hypothetical protein